MVPNPHWLSWERLQVRGITDKVVVVCGLIIIGLVGCFLSSNKHSAETKFVALVLNPSSLSYEVGFWRISDDDDDNDHQYSFHLFFNYHCIMREWQKTRTPWRRFWLYNEWLFDQRTNKDNPATTDFISHTLHHNPPQSLSHFKQPISTAQIDILA